MEKLIDLHTHSLMSDGSMTPTEVVRAAKQANLSAIALSDHDCIDGVREAMAEGERIGVEVIPAIEFSAQADTETHILGYGIDIENPILIEAMKETRQLRLRRNEITCQKLNELGFDIKLEEVRSMTHNDFVGRSHFARLMYDKGYVSSPKEAFRLYLENGKYAYCTEQRFSDEEIVKLIKQSGGLSFVAHLHLTKKDDDELISFLERLKNVGLNGVEGYYSEYTPEMQNKYQKIASDLGLIISGGTDFHGSIKPHINIGTGLGNLKIPYSILETIKERL